MQKKRYNENHEKGNNGKYRRRSFGPLLRGVPARGRPFAGTRGAGGQKTFLYGKRTGQRHEHKHVKVTLFFFCARYFRPTFGRTVRARRKGHAHIFSRVGRTFPARRARAGLSRRPAGFLRDGPFEICGHGEGSVRPYGRFRNVDRTGERRL